MTGPIATALLAELDTEMATTRKILSRIPAEKRDFSPHAKSWPLFKLATHVAQLPLWMAVTVNTDELDLEAPWPTPEWTTTEQLLAILEEAVAAARKSLEGRDDAYFAKPWTLRGGAAVYFTMPRASVVRNMCMNHHVHHRAQLSIYLRLLDVPLPNMYGPSADEQ
jgi:uncharacterized damage-inducible protein DinB